MFLDKAHHRLPLLGILSLCVVLFGCDKQDAVATHNDTQKTPSIEPAALPTPEISLKLALLHKQTDLVQHVETHSELGRLWLAHRDEPLEEVEKHSQRAISLWSTKGLALIDGPKKTRLAQYAAQAIYQLGEVERARMKKRRITSNDQLNFIKEFKAKSTHQEAASQMHIKLLQHCQVFCPKAYWSAMSTVQHARAYKHMADTIIGLLKTPQKKTLMASTAPAMIEVHMTMAKNQYIMASKIPGTDPRTLHWKTIAQKELCTLDGNACNGK